MAPDEAPTQAPDQGAGVISGQLVLVGGGEHARVVADAADAAGWTLLGWTDADPRAWIPGVRRLGTDDDLVTHLDALPGGDGTALVLGFAASVDARRVAVARLGSRVAWATIVHPSATVSRGATLEAGVVVLAGAVVNTGAHIGPHAIVNTHAVAEHDVVIGAYAHLAPGATVGGGARIGDGAFIGLGAAIRDHIEVGADAVVGMGAVVVTDVPAAATVVGNPARPPVQAP
jgi:acetyltransferase EpsM